MYMYIQQYCTLDIKLLYYYYQYNTISVYINVDEMPVVPAWVLRAPDDLSR